MPSSFQPDLAFCGADPPDWLRRFAAEPLGALEDLLLGRAALGHLGAAEPVEVLLDWLEGIDPEAGFAGKLDEASASWVERSWGSPVLMAAAGSSAVTARAWCRMADLIASEPRLTGAAEQLRELFPHEPQFLRALSEGRARDPEGRCWLALARHQEGRGLLDHWWRLCSLPPDVPWYHGACGIVGLRGLPAESEHREGTFPTEVAEGLARLAVALARREGEGWLSEKAAREEFQRTARMTMAAYPWPERWLSFWRHSLAAHRIRAEAAEVWVRALFPEKLKPESTRRFRGRSRYLKLPDPDWRRQAQEIARGLEAASPEAIRKANKLLQVEGTFARLTGDSFAVVRSATTFASRTRKQRPDLALEWAELARQYEPWNAFAWTTVAAALRALGRPQEATRISLGAVERFPENVVARTGLGEALKAGNQNEAAVAVFRETVERFPQDVVARNGLGEALKAGNQNEAAVAVFRETVERFPRDVVARSALERTLEAMEHSGESEVAQPAIAEALPPPSPPDDYRTSDTVAETKGIYDAGATSEDLAISPLPPEPRQAPEADRLDLRRRDVEILVQDVYMLRRWTRSVGGDGGGRTTPGNLRERASRLLGRLARFQEVSAEAAGELGLLEIDSGDLDDAVQLLRGAARRFPGSARVKYALARAERELAAHQERPFDLETSHELIRPWQRLARLDNRYRPVQLLGEGRTWLGQVDGAFVERQARKTLGQLGFWMHGITSGDRPSGVGDENGFPRWWAQEVQRSLFGEARISRESDLRSLDPIHDRMLRHQWDLNVLEETWVRQVGRA